MHGLRKIKWLNVHTAEADACAWMPPEGAADLVLFSYSLTMIPDWIGVLEHAWRMLKPGGCVAVVDFYVSRKHPAADHVRHSAFTRHFWPTWFSWDDVFLNPDHLPYLERRFETVKRVESTGAIPYLPGSRVPYYQFVGRKPLDSEPS